jgi:fructokinase
MQIGIDLGATKIESVLLDNNGSELHRERVNSPKNYRDTIESIKNVVNIIEKKFNKKFNLGVCHPGSINIDTGLIQNATNSPWLNKMKFPEDISKSLNKKVLCENDANCFALSESYDGSAKHYKIVFGVILGSGCGGGLVIDKKILVGPNSLAGEWGHIGLPGDDKKRTIQDCVSGKGLEKLYLAKFNKDISAKEIFSKARKKSSDDKDFIKDFLNNLGLSLSVIINAIDPDAIVFGGGVSNELESLENLKEITEQYLKSSSLKSINLRTVFLKPKYGDASGVRGAALLGRKLIY